MIGDMGRIQSLVAQRRFVVQDRRVAEIARQLATGLRINRAADDPSGLIASEHLRADLAELEAQTRAMERADAMANVASGALAEISSLITEAQGLAVARANTGGYSPAELDAYQLEMDSMIQAVDRIVATTSFDGSRLLDGGSTLAAAGASLPIESASTSDLGEVKYGGATRHLTDARFGGALADDPAAAFAAARAAGATVGAILGRIGAFQRNTIAPAMRSHAVAIETVSAAHSAVRDTDYTAATAALARATALRDTAGAVLALANSAPTRVLGLLTMRA